MKITPEQDTNPQTLRKPMNTETKHTPGPWHTDGSRIWHQANPGGLKLWIAETLQGNDTARQRYANAALIASAPDMAKELAQLKADRRELVARLSDLMKEISSRFDYETATPEEEAQFCKTEALIKRYENIAH